MAWCRGPAATDCLDPDHVAAANAAFEKLFHGRLHHLTMEALSAPENYLRKIRSYEKRLDGRPIVPFATENDYYRLIVKDPLRIQEEHFQELNARGFDVISFDWRGQGLSQRLLAHPAKGYVDSFDQYLTDLETVLNEVLPRCQGPMMLLAHSMGGHIALRYLHKNPGLFAKAVLCAPMIDINSAPMPKFLARLITRWLRRAGFARTMIAGAGYLTPMGMPSATIG